MMYRLHTLINITTHGEKLCIMSDDVDSIRLHALTGKLPVLVKLLTTGFLKNRLFRVLDPQHHPKWHQEALWQKLSPLLISTTPIETRHLDRFSEFTRYRSEIAHVGNDILWARQQQVLHIPVLNSVIIEALHLLTQAGFEAYISYDDSLVTSGDISHHLHSSHIGESKTDAVRKILTAKNSTVMFGSPAAFSHQKIGTNHHILWHLDDNNSARTTPLKALTAGLRILPVQTLDAAQLVGPLIQSDEPPCWDCYQNYSQQIRMGSDSKLPPTSYQLGITSSMVLNYFQELAEEWLLSQKHGQTLQHSRLSQTAMLISHAAVPVAVPGTPAPNTCICQMTAQ